MKKLAKANVLLLIFFCCLFLKTQALAVIDDCPVSTVQETVTLMLEWDPNNPEEVGPGSSVEVKVIGRCPPYTWNVSGNGFSLAESETPTEFNTLIADENACGTAGIDVTDSCGNQVSGELRSTSGEWQDYEPVSCMVPGDPNDGDSCRIKGGWRQCQGYRRYGMSSTGGCGRFSRKCSDGVGNCRDGSCLQGLYCDPVWGCTQCVTNMFYCNDRALCPGYWWLCTKYSCPDGSWWEIYCICSTGLSLQRWSCPQ